MTANLTNATLDWLEYLYASGETRSLLRMKLWRTTPVLVGFGMGTVIGGTSVKFVHFRGC